KSNKKQTPKLARNPSISCHRKTKENVMWGTLQRLSGIGCGLAAAILASIVGASLGCSKAVGVKAEPVVVVSDPATNVELLFTYGSEKESWLDEVNKAFNGRDTKTKSGKAIRVKGMAVGSGELVDEVLKGRRKAHLISPASAAYLELGNADARAAGGKELV